MNNTGQAVPLSNGVKPTSGLCNKSALRGCVFRKNAGPPLCLRKSDSRAPRRPHPWCGGPGAGHTPRTASSRLCRGGVLGCTCQLSQETILTTLQLKLLFEQNDSISQVNSITCSKIWVPSGLSLKKKKT